MNCDCNQCTSRLGRLWTWLEAPPGPLSSCFTAAWMSGLVAALCWWGR